MPARRASVFSPQLFKFLRELTVNNDREWFGENKERYEKHVREPALAFIRLMGPRLAKVSPHFLALDKKVGGSLMRIHRDVRFSRDKSPYKTNVGIQFRHDSGKDVHAPGFYVHLAADGCFVAAGTWHPEAPALAAIRARLDSHPDAWKKLLKAKRFASAFKLEGESLKRPPRGVPADHPLLEDLKRKDHVAVAHLKTSQVTADDFPATVGTLFRDSAPYLRFLCEAMGAEF